MSGLGRSPGEIFGLEGAVAVVTGASAGLGARFAEVLVAAGAQVVVAARRLELLEELASRDARIHPVACDVSRDGDRTRLIDRAVELGGVQVLVNNAAAAGATSTAEEDADAFSRVLDVNLVAAYDLARLAVERSPRPPSSIVNVGSILGLVSGAPLAGAAYASSKAGLVGLTRELAGQWARLGVRVNALVPGWVETEMTAALRSDEKAAAWVDRHTPLRRMGTVEELDGALLLLASGASSFMTGQTVVVDGGWTAR